MRFVIAHGHIFKNAGTTFDWSLQRNFGDGFLDHRDDDAMREQGPEHIRELVERNAGLVALSSHHLCRFMPEMPGTMFLPVYFLRHPIERVASVYEFEREQEADTPGARAAKEKNFADYVAWRMRARVGGVIRNYQTLYLAGATARRSEAKFGLGVFGRAMATLRAVSDIGIVDRYDESIVLIEQAWRSHFPELNLAYIRQNASRRTDSGSVETKVQKVLSRLEGQQQQLIDSNSLDLAIYHLVNQRLDTRIAQYPDFEQHLTDFRARCAALKKRSLFRS